MATFGKVRKAVEKYDDATRRLSYAKNKLDEITYNTHSATHTVDILSEYTYSCKAGHIDTLRLQHVRVEDVLKMEIAELEKEVADLAMKLSQMGVDVDE